MVEVPEPQQNQGSAGAIDPVAGKSVAAVFGEIVWVMSQNKKARELQIKDLENLVMPAILPKQFHITYAPGPTGRTASGEPVRGSDANPTFSQYRWSCSQCARTKL